MARSRSRQPVLFADPAEVREFAAHLSEALLQCRELGHLWSPWTASWSNTEGCYHRTLRCDRCTTERSQTLSDKGTVLTNQYAYPEGYLHAGMGRIAGDGRDMLRLESVLRSTQGPPNFKKKNTSRKRRAA